MNKASTLPAGLDMGKIEETARDFEAMFLSEMLRPMFESVEVDETFGGGRGEEVFRGFLRDEYSKILAMNQSVGIAEQVKQELIALQSRAAEANVARNMQGLTGATGAPTTMTTKE
jgi:Rod binding domain-containing protein